VLAAIDKVQAHDDPTQGSGSSGYSDLSALENETDEFGRRLLQYEKDQRRVRSAVDGNLQAFGRARPGTRATGFFGRDEEGTSAGQDPERVGSSGSNESDPPLNIPRLWGRKGRVRDEWLRKRHASVEAEVPVLEGPQDAYRHDADAIIPHRTVYTGDEDWTNVGNEPLQSIETTPPSMRRQRMDSRSSSMQHMNTTLQEIMESEEQDFTAASLLASTPAVNRRDRRIDELTRRELETVESQRITKRSLQDLFKSATVKSNESRPATAPSGEVRQRPRRRRSLISNKENVAPSGDVNSNYKGSGTVSIVNRNAQAVTFKSAQRPANKRHDSIDYLRALSRVSSMSPSPNKNRTEHDVLEKRPRSQPEADVGRTVKSTSDEEMFSRRTSDISRDYEQNLEDVPVDDVHPVETDGNGDVDVQRELQGAADEMDTTPAPREGPTDTKTPVVTGAWVETPSRGLDVRPLLQTTDSTIVRAFGSPSGNATLEPISNVLDNDTRRIQSEPMLAKSALADILTEAKNAPDAQFGDTTLQSLEDIVNPDHDQNDPTLTVDIDDMAEKDDASAPQEDEALTQAENDRRQERLAMEAMNKHLRAARTSLKDANRGMRRVENRIETAQQRKPPQAPSSQSSLKPSAPAVVRRGGRTVCEACGGTYNGSVWYALWSELRSCFYTYDRRSNFPPSIRLTILGLLCLSWLAWYIIESTLCSYYCHPLYAYEMEGFGVDPDAPMFPFVIPTLVFRPFRFVWVPAVEYLAWAGGVMGNAVWGDNAASADPPVARPVYGMGVESVLADAVKEGGWVATATQASVRVTQSLVQALDDAGSMWDDEYLS